MAEAKVHMTVNGAPMCPVKAKSPVLTNDPALVTCKRCLKAMEKAQAEQEAVVPEEEVAEAPEEEQAEPEIDEYDWDGDEMDDDEFFSDLEDEEEAV